MPGTTKPLIQEDAPARMPKWAKWLLVIAAGIVVIMFILRALVAYHNATLLSADPRFQIDATCTGQSGELVAFGKSSSLQREFIASLPVANKQGCWSQIVTPKAWHNTWHFKDIDVDPETKIYFMVPGSFQPIGPIGINDTVRFERPLPPTFWIQTTKPTRIKFWTSVELPDPPSEPTAEVEGFNPIKQ